MADSAPPETGADRSEGAPVADRARHLRVVPGGSPPAPTFDPGPDPGDDGARLREVIGAVLREERRRQGRTLADVAEEAAVSLPYLSEIERGRKEVSSDLLHVVHEALGLELVDVLERAAQRLRVGSQRGPGPLLLAA